MNIKTKNIVHSALFLAIAIVFQFIGKFFPQVSQVFVGPAVNAVLILTAYVCGLSLGVVVCILTPLLAWLLGQLNPAFAPFVPFIMIGNAVYIIVFYMFKNQKVIGQFIGIVLGGFLKFIVLFFSASKLLHLLGIVINPPMAGKMLIKAMGVLQFITAVIGGIAALIIINLLKRRNQI